MGTVVRGTRTWIACRLSVLLAVVIAMGFAAPAGAAVQPVGDATATVETVPVLSTGDAADDPAVWVHPSDPARSVVIGNDKGGALEVYDLSGARIQRIAEGFFGNVDVRRSVPVGSSAVDVVGVYRLGLRFYRIDPATRTLTNITDDPSGSIRAPFGGEGFCLYRSPSSGRLSAFVNARDGRIAQFELGDVDGDGLIDGRRVRAWDVGGEVEGCVADDGLGKLYVSEEAVGIWKYGAEPTAPTGPAGRVARRRHDTRWRSAGAGCRGPHDRLPAEWHRLPDRLVAGRLEHGQLLRGLRAAGRQRLRPELPGCQRPGDRRLWPDRRHRRGRCEPRTGVPARNVRLPGQQQLDAGHLRQPELQAGPAGTGGRAGSNRLTNTPPTARFTASCTGLDCTLDGSGSSDPNGPIASYEWDFGDGAKRVRRRPGACPHQRRDIPGHADGHRRR